MDTTKKFDGYADDYTAGRPGYAESLIDYFYDRCGVTADSVIADIGSGTGKFAVHLLRRGNNVYCVEPGDDMRRVAEQELRSYENFHSVAGGAEDTSLESDSVDFITTAQAFHWFDVSRFRAECSRVLRDHGKVFLIWNVRNEDDPVNSELYQIYKKYCPAFNGFGGGITKDDPRIIEFFSGKYDMVSFDNPLSFDKEKFIFRSLSGSYSIKDGDPDYEDYMREIIGVFDRYQQNGIVSIGNASVAYIGSLE